MPGVAEASAPGWAAVAQRLWAPGGWAELTRRSESNRTLVPQGSVGHCEGFVYFEGSGDFEQRSDTICLILQQGHPGCRVENRQ